MLGVFGCLAPEALGYGNWCAQFLEKPFTTRANLFKFTDH